MANDTEGLTFKQRLFSQYPRLAMYDAGLYESDNAMRERLAMQDLLDRYGNNPSVINYFRTLAANRGNYQDIKKTGAFTDMAKTMIPYANGAAMAPGRWKDHNDAYGAISQKYEGMLGGYNRKSRDAKGLHGAADAALRYPENSQLSMQVLAFLYQMKQAGFDIVSGNPSEIKQEFKDYLANSEGIKLANKLRKAGYTPEQIDQLLEQAAMQYADPLGTTIK